MRIGIDARALTGRYTGDRTYWLNLIRALVAHGEDEYVLYSRLPVPDDALPHSPRVSFRAVPASNDRLWTFLTFPRALKRDGIDLAHTQYTTPLSVPCPIVTTVHDISFRLYPEWFQRKHRLLLNLSVPSAMRRACRVITDSESSRRDILRIYKLPPEKVNAIPLAAAPEYAPVPQETAREAVNQRFGFSGPYVLSVGVLQPRKNLPLLLEAFACARCRGRLSHQLVIAGKRGWGCEDLSRQAARLNIADSLRFTDYVADADLPTLYSACDMTAYPSLYEGFGLPPLEAMACGAPTLVSDAPAMPEVAGDGAWILPVMDSGAWSDAIECLAQNPSARKDWGSRAIRRAAQFSWQRTAAATRAVYTQIVEQSIPVAGV